MTLSLFRVTAFDGLTLHNGSTHLAMEWIDYVPKANLNMIKLANGALFDMDLSLNATRIPQPFVAKHVLKFTSKADADAAAQAIKDKVGRRGTVTAEPYGQATANETCLARLEQVTIEKRLRNPSIILVVNLNFVPVEEFSA